MKTDRIVLALLFNGISAVTLNQQPLQLSQQAVDAGNKMQATLKGMKDEEIVSLMQKQIKDAKETKKDDKKDAPTDAEAKDAEMKQVEAALSRRILDRLAGGYGPYSAYPWAGSPLLDRVAAVHSYHDMVLGYENAHNIYGYLVPTLDDVHKVLDIVTDTSGMVAGKGGIPVPADPVNTSGKLGAEVAAATSTIKARVGEEIAADAKAPKAESLLQTSAEGVPVLVMPKLLVNQAGDMDLRQRGYIMDGVDGYDFVQLQDDVPEDNTVLQVNGVPVFVNPKLLVNTAGDLDLRLRDQIIDGVNGYDYVQIPDEDRAKADFQFLNQQFGDVSPAPKGMTSIMTKADTSELIQVETTGVPVLVNPESMLDTNTMASANLGISKMEMGPDEVSILQHKADFSPVFEDSVTLMVNGVSRTISGKQNAPVDNTHLQLGNPVNNPPYNNWSVNQPSVPHDSGDAGHQDLGVRNIIIDGVNGYDFVQLGNPVNNPPYNNWSVNQPSVPHDSGDAGHQDLGVRNIIIDGVNGYDFVQTTQV